MNMKIMKKFILLLLGGMISLHASAQIADTINMQNKKLDIHFGAFKTHYYLNERAIPKKEFKSLLFTREEAKAEYKRGSTYLTFGYVIGIPSVILLLTQLQDYHTNPPYPEVFIGSIIGTAGGFLLEYIGRKKIKKSIDVFNAEHVKTSFILKPDGVGLALNF
jgi:hypothetical protein